MTIDEQPSARALRYAHDVRWPDSRIDLARLCEHYGDERAAEARRAADAEIAKLSAPFGVDVLELARQAIRRGAKLGESIPSCSCFDELKKPRDCNGVCEDAAEFIAHALQQYGAELVREIASERSKVAYRDAEIAQLRVPHGDERAAAAREAALEEAALVCDGRSLWAEVQITDDDTRPYAAYSVGCDRCAEMIRALAAKRSAPDG